MVKHMRLSWLLLPTLLVFGYTARAEEEAQAPATAVTPEKRDVALAKAIRFLDEKMDVGVFKRGEPWRYGNAKKSLRLAAAVAGWAYLMAKDGEGAKLPSRSKQLREIHAESLRYVRAMHSSYVAYAAWLVKPSLSSKRKVRSAHGTPNLAGPFTWIIGPTTFFFAESFARRNAKSKSEIALRQALLILETSQQSDGGWGHGDHAYQYWESKAPPEPKIPNHPLGLDFVYPPTLVASSNCAAPALSTAARLLGLGERESVRKALAFYRALAQRSGGFRYSRWREDPSTGRIGVARTGGSLFALLGLGVSREDEMFKRSAQLVDRHLDWLTESHGSESWGLLLAALGARTRGAEAWKAFRRALFLRIVEAQTQSGALPCVCSMGKPYCECTYQGSSSIGFSTVARTEADALVYTTAINTFILMLDRTRPLALPPEQKKAGVTEK